MFAACGKHLIAPGSIQYHVNSASLHCLVEGDVHQNDGVEQYIRVVCHLVEIRAETLRVVAEIIGFHAALLDDVLYVRSLVARKPLEDVRERLQPRDRKSVGIAKTSGLVA